MPNLTTGFPKRTGNLEEDYENLYNWSVSLIDELKSILCNLDSGNVTEANSVKAQNIDCTQARIKDAQMQSLTADKLTAGTIDAGQITVKGESDNGKMVMSGEKLVFFETGNDKPRIYIGRDGDDYIFSVQNSDATQGIYMDESGNIVITGVFSTGTENEARTVIDRNGIQSYDASGQKYGLWCNDADTYGRRYVDFILYYAGKEVFKVYNGIAHTSLFLSGNQIMLSGNGVTTGIGKWLFQHGANGGFQTADGKIVTVEGGLITGISDGIL